MLFLFYCLVVICSQKNLENVLFGFDLSFSVMDLIFFFDYNMMLLYVLLDVLQFDYDMKEDILNYNSGNWVNEY